MSTVRLLLINVNLVTNVASAEFQRLDASGEPERGRPRHKVTLSDELLLALRTEVLDQVTRDIEPLATTPSTLLTSELHRLRETRHARADEERMAREALAASTEKLQATQAEHETLATAAAAEAVRLQALREEAAKREAEIHALDTKKAEALSEHATLEAKIAERNTELDQLTSRRAEVLDAHADKIAKEER